MSQQVDREPPYSDSFHLSYLSKNPSFAGVQLYKELSEGAPQSPLTGSTVSSQESSAADSMDQSSARSILTLGSMGSHSSFGPNLGLELPSPSNGNLEGSRSTGMLYGFSELPSPSVGPPAQEKLRGKWNGRGRGAYSGDHNSSRTRNSSYRHLFKQVTKIGSGQSLVDMGFPEATLTVEHLVSLVKSLPANQLAVPAVAHGLHFMDSRAVAALLKDIAKNGLPHRAVEIFDWLRSLPPSHELHHLCDVYTYTTVIALCGQRQSLRLALELVAEMRSRGVNCNVHTYSALMNTCIKCGELELALDVFNQLKHEGCVANVVTFNTLVDVYGKLGQWQDAIRVLDQLYLQGLEPETRTFNTVIIAANMCNQPLEALKVYERMIASGFRPSATTYTALISAYGKAGQLENALQVFNQMIKVHCERNIITYGSLISACERAGKWQLALDLVDEMRRDHVFPNTMTYNALLSACAQGGQSDKAEGLFHSMVNRRCKPDQSTYNALMLAHIRAGHWRAALQALESMQAAGNKPEQSLYASLLQCLWDSAVPAAQVHALRLLMLGCRTGAVSAPLHQSIKDDNTLQVLITASNSCIAILALHKWLRETLERLELKGDTCLGHAVVILAGCTKADPSFPADQATLQLEVQAAITGMLEGMNSSFRAETSSHQSRLIAKSWDVIKWMQKEETKTAIADYLPSCSPDMRSGRESHASHTIASQETSANAAMVELHTLFCQAEGHQEARKAAAEAVYAGSREECLKLANELAKRFSICHEAVYRAMILLDYSLVAGVSYTLGGAAALVAACLTIGARQCNPGSAAAGQPNTTAVETVLGIAPGSLLPVIEQLQRIGVADSPIASPITALNRYLNYLGQDAVTEPGSPEAPLTPRASARLTGNSKRLLTAALAHASTQHIRPSLLAAAALAVDRKARGFTPSWPSSLRRWTGLAGPQDPAFEAAMQAVLALPIPSQSSPRF